MKRDFRDRAWNQSRLRLVHVNPALFEHCPNERRLGHESPEEWAAAQARARRNAILLDWVRRRMRSRLTRRECECLRLHYFEGRTFAETGRRTGTSPSACCRAAARGVARLRAAARDEGVTWTRGGRPPAPANAGDQPPAASGPSGVNTVSR